MISLQCCRKECSIPKDIQHILTGRNEERLPLMHFDAVDICFTSETHYHNKRVYMIVYLCRHLYHDTINIEIRTVDKLEGHRDRYHRTVRMLIIRKLLIFSIVYVGFELLVIMERLANHYVATECPVCRPLDDRIWNACKT